jgi:hypothetical protein
VTNTQTIILLVEVGVVAFVALVSLFRGRSG